MGTLRRFCSGILIALGQAIACWRPSHFLEALGYLRSDEKRSQIFTDFSGLTIVIACLGLLGLAAFTTEQRTKEIGVRKVIGASVRHLVMLVSKEFVLLVGTGMILAFPVAWYITEDWLENFAYRIELQAEWPTFLLSALMAFLITLITVGFHVIRAASANPVKSLRDE